MTTAFTPEDWDRYAVCYDSLLSLHPYRGMLKKVAEQSLLHEPSKILDASCGTGNFALTLAHLAGSDPWSLLGVDMSTAMLSLAGKKCAELSSCQFTPANLDVRLPFADTSFSQVVSLNTLYAVTSPAQTLKEFHRVLKQGGHLLLVTPRDDYENGFILREHCWSKKPLSYWAGIHNDPVREEQLVREAIKDNSVIEAMLEVARINREIAKTGKHHFLTTAELISLLGSCGFAVTQTSSVYAGQDDFVIAEKRSNHATY